MDVPPMIFSGNALTVQPGMVFFPHVMLGDADSGRAVGLGDSVLITAEGAESLSRLPRELIIK
jgi:Xaa-Pro dipeptidase